MNYGIGRVPQDIDQASEAMAEIQAETIQPTPRPTKTTLRCKVCRQIGPTGEYPFSTDASSGICDDCY